MTSAPMAFTFGLGITLMFPLRFGAAAATIEQATPSTMAEAIVKHGVTHLGTAPTAYKAMLSQPALEQALKTLRYCISAGEHLPEATWRAWKDRTGIAITDGIGSTEMMHIFVSAVGDEIRPGSTGRAVPGYEACILDPDGNEVAEGVGRLAIKGPTGCRYLDDPRQRDYVVDGWNVTGDTYRRDADGYFWYLARSDDMIVSSGYNIGAPEVENALLSHPAVAECAVIGVPCPERGQKVKAFVVLADGREASDGLVAELQNHVKAQIAPYKYPREIEFAAALPKTATGKLRRSELRLNAAP
jgi:2-aminobenzoate-CoA ligase